MVGRRYAWFLNSNLVEHDKTAGEVHNRLLPVLKLCLRSEFTQETPRRFGGHQRAHSPEVGKQRIKVGANRPVFFAFALTQYKKCQDDSPHGSAGIREHSPEVRKQLRWELYSKHYSSNNNRIAKTKTLRILWGPQNMRRTNTINEKYL